MDEIGQSSNRAATSLSALSRSNSAINSVAFSALRAETSVKALSSAFTLLGTAVGGLAGGVAANALKNYADTYTNIQNRLRATIPDSQARLQVDQQIYDTAQKTRTSYEATANLFSRLTLSSTQLGASQTQILRVVETTQKALVSGGATVQEAASIATQLTQALGSGRLQGDELRSIAENSPVLIQAIAREFGVTVGALKDLGSQGELTADRVFKAILNAGKEVDEVFARTTPTIAAGIQQIDNALTRYLGNLDKSIGATKALTQGLGFVANNMNGIGDSVLLAVAALSGPVASRFLTAGAQRATAPIRAVSAERQADLQAAQQAQRQAAFARQAAFNRFFEAQAAADKARTTPALALANPDVLKGLETAEKNLAGARGALASATDKANQAEARRAQVASVAATASKTALNAEAAAQTALDKRNAVVEQRAEAFLTAAARAEAATGALTKKQQEAFREAVGRRGLLEPEFTAAQQRVEGIQGQIAGLPQRPAAASTSRRKQEALNAYNEALAEAVAERDSLGQRLNEAGREIEGREDKLRQVNNAAREKALASATTAERRLEAAEAAVRAAQVNLGQRERDRIGAPPGQDAPARSAAQVMGLIEKEVDAQIALDKALVTRNALADDYLKKIQAADLAAGSLSATEYKALSAARQARAALTPQYDEAVRRVAVLQQDRDAVDTVIGKKARASLAKDAETQAFRESLNADLKAAVADRDRIGSQLQAELRTINDSEDRLRQTGTVARENAAQAVIEADKKLGAAQAEAVAQQQVLKERRAAVNASLVLSEQEKAKRLAAVDQEISALTARQRDLATARAFSERGVTASRRAVENSAAGNQAAADAEAALAARSLEGARTSVTRTQDAVETASRRASTLQVALGSAANVGRAAFGGLVSLLGGPLGAAITAASVGFIGYELYQARAAAAAEKHADALGKLIDRTKELNTLRARGEGRSPIEQQQDNRLQVEALRGVVDQRSKALDAFGSAASDAMRRAGYGVEGGSTAENDLDRAAARLGINLAEAARNARQLDPASEGAAKATRQLADVMLEAAKADPRYAERAIEVARFAAAQEEAAKKVRANADALAAQRDLESRLRSRKAVYDADEGGPLSRGDFVDPERAKRQLDEIKTYAQSVGESLMKIGEGGYNFPELQELRTQLQAAVQDIANVRASASTMLSGVYVPTELKALVADFSAGKVSVEDYAQALLKARESMPNFRPLIDSLLEASQKALTASANLADVGAQVDALDGKSATINITVKTTSIGSIKAADAQQVEDQAAAGDKALTELQAKTQNLRLQAAGKTALASAMEAKQSNPGLDIGKATREFEQQEKLQEQISANNRKGRKKSGKPKKTDAEKTEDKITDLDQQAQIAILSDFDRKTVQFAQSAKVAKDNIQAFIDAAKSGDLSGVPPVMQQIYEKMKVLEGTKLARTTLDEIFPARKLAQDLEAVRAAAEKSPEIAANLELIQAKIREKAAPEWASGATSAMTDLVKSVANGTATMADALATFKKRVIDLALDAAFKPLQTALTNIFTKLGEGGFNIGSLFSGGLSGGSNFAGQAPDAIGPFLPASMHHEGGIVGVHGVARRRLPISVIRSAPRFHSGLTGKEFPAVLEAGERVLTERMSRSTTRTIAGLTAATAGAGGGKPELHIHAGDRTEVTQSNGPQGLRTDVMIDKKVASVLMGGPATRGALKQISGARLVGK
ncbi:tape measure protein [Methylobacterium ajmalii]|uniref:Tape measure protein n=1 Tax=Methylobacterium ajmalii TaxID=2738439 RepID=A0ABV0A4H2_9HYPH